MSMQYPDTARFTILSGGGYNALTGEDEAGVISHESVIGRYDTSIGNRLIQQSSALSFIPQFVFYMPLGQAEIPLGTMLTVFDSSSNKEYSGIVRMYNKGSFNAYAVCGNV